MKISVFISTLAATASFVQASVEDTAARLQRREWEARHGRGKHAKESAPGYEQAAPAGYGGVKDQCIPFQQGQIPTGPPPRGAYGAFSVENEEDELESYSTWSDAKKKACWKKVCTVTPVPPPVVKPLPPVPAPTPTPTAAAPQPVQPQAATQPVAVQPTLAVSAVPTTPAPTAVPTVATAPLPLILNSGTTPSVHIVHIVPLVTIIMYLLVL